MAGDGSDDATGGDRRERGERRRTIDLTWLEDGMPERREVVGLERRVPDGFGPDGPVDGETDVGSRGIADGPDGPDSPDSPDSGDGAGNGSDGRPDNGSASAEAADRSGSG